MSIETLTAARTNASSSSNLVEPQAATVQGAAGALPSMDPRESERGRAQLLVQAANGDQQQLEELRAEYLRRLHLASDDFEATEGLRIVEPALAKAARPEGVWAWLRREREREGKWWRRLRR